MDTKPTSLSKRRLGEDPDRFLSYMNQEVSGTTTGIARLDSALLGLAGFVSLVGEPKACKSTLALQIAIANAKQGNPVFFIDQENGRYRLARRLLCHLHASAWGKIKYLPGLRQAYQGLAQLPLYFHFGSVDLETIEQGVQQMLQSHPGKRAMLVIDSLQAVQHRLDDMRVSVDQWLLGLDALKLKYDGHLTILVICEKSRARYGQASVDAAKESGRIEYKVEQQLDLRNNGELVILEVTLNRDGPRGIQVALRKCLQNPRDENSFIFKLEEVKEIDL